MKRKGFTIIEMVISMFLIGILILILVNFKRYAYKTISESNRDIKNLEIINNKIVEIYSLKHWDLIEEETIEKDNINLDLKYSYEPKTEYNTERLIVQFMCEAENQEYVLERSLIPKSKN